MDIEEKVLQEIKPTPEEERGIMEAAERLLREAKQVISDMNLDAEPILVGSVAKGTFLKNPDLDVFIMFPSDTPQDILESKGLEIGKKLIKDGRENYAEHPYINGTFMGYEVDLVPCYRIEDTGRRMSAVDRTPFHTEYVTEHMNEEQKDQSRLLKAFMKGIGVYGAEAEIEGFSGYLVELLIIYYGSFRDVLEASHSWKRGTRLHLGNDTGKKLNGPFIFIDPVDSKRNVASALSVDSYATFIHAASEYLEDPDRRFFFPPEREPMPASKLTAEAERRGTHIFGILIGRPELVDDIIFPQIKKSRRIVSQRLNDAGFNVINSGYTVYDSEILFMFEVEISVISSVKRHYGPPVWNPNASDFREKWRKYLLKIDSGRWVAYTERGYSTPEEYLKKTLHEHNIGKDLREEAKKGFSMLSMEEIAEKHALSLTEMLFPLFPWERTPHQAL